MRSVEQEIKMLKNLSDILKLLPTTKSIKEISEKTGIPTSTIQRYLNSKELIIKLLEQEKIENYGKIFETIQTWLHQAKVEGNKKGGLISQEKHSYSKNETGQFNGNNKSR